MTAAIDARSFRRVMARYPTGVVVVTAVDPDGVPAAMTVGSFTSASLDPPLVAFLPGKSSTTWPRIEAAGRFCINVLGAHQAELCRAFARRGTDRFSHASWRTASSGSPLLRGVIAWIDCDLYQVSEAGDHYIVLGAVREMGAGEAAEPLIFHCGALGHFRPLTGPS
jgi:flavin reductase (DIM6/NTAB) family NADH-FMN oxidoreductase RutF